MTHTYATLEVSAAAYDEIRAKLEKAGYADQFISQPAKGREVIDMHGIGLVRASEDDIGERLLRACQEQTSEVQVEQFDPNV